MTKTIAECLQQRTVLGSVSESPRLDAEVLLAWVLGKSRSYLYTWPEKALGENETRLYQEAIARRSHGEPIAHIVGEKEFWSLPLHVDASTLIPRPETELIVEKALELFPAQRPIKILDLGTGSGAIAIALASEYRLASVDAVDFSADALALANKNVVRNKLNNVRIYQSHWFERVDNVFDLIVSNPPYIDASDPHLNQGDLAFEPRTALVAEHSGLGDLRYIVGAAGKCMKEEAWLLVEHGWQQGRELRNFFERNKYQSIKTLKDYSGNDRVTMGQYTNGGC